jgi:ankyrin repeat protein
MIRIVLLGCFYRFLAQRGQLNLDKEMVLTAFDGNALKVRALLAAGADVHANGDDALIFATTMGHAEVISALVESGARLTTPMIVRYAVANGHEKALEVLLQAGADGPADLERALSDARQAGNAAMAQMLERALLLRSVEGHGQGETVRSKNR